MSDKSKLLARLNDDFRKAIGTKQQSGRVLKTMGIDNLQTEDQDKIFDLVRTYNDFSKANDPYGEHDFGRIEYKSNIVYWKIDYYDRGGEVGSPDPTDSRLTARVITLLLAHEW